MCRFRFVLIAVLIPFMSQLEIKAFKVEFQAFDAAEPLQRFQKPFYDPQRMTNGLYADPPVETLVDVLTEINDVANSTEPCHIIMHQIAVQGGNFTHCLLSRARPFRVCENCIEEYTVFTNLYKDLLKDNRCSSVLLMADRMQVITSIYQVVITTWSSADCDLCFVPGSVHENSTTHTVTFNFTEDTILFQQMQANVSKCFNDSDKIIDTGESKVCKDCKQVYKLMNDKFVGLNKDSSGQICMDLIDMMNYTRLMWSSKYHCVRPRPDATGVIAITVIMALITVLLYTSSKFIAKIRMPQIFKAKRMLTVSGSGGYGSISQVQQNLQRVATSSSSPSLTDRRRSDSNRDVDGNGFHPVRT